ncbi:histidine acid phosphatase [Ancylostoma ceylanicum]|uniref:Histidine acid phosphatase n=1 Tax=Ancylostoma ceylanicum TaxID=53326 RepID=A0A0D6LMW0_9BILA|nr:histidine acid phosphatase [Ancylostoma ceylanicum]
MFFALLALASTGMALTDGEMELVLVQVIWRHGDRSPTLTFQSDPFKEGNWTFGGGGFGQLSPTGMKQHFNFGKQMRKKYVETKFLGPKYSSKEIYIRSSDVNRTIISAMANMMGMYGQNDGTSIKGIDYPDVQGWPAGYVPIAVHTVDHDTDHTLVPHAPCDRQDWLWGMAKQSDEVHAFLNSSDVRKLFKNLSTNCKEDIHVDNLWIVRDALMIEVNKLISWVNKIPAQDATHIWETGVKRMGSRSQLTQWIYVISRLRI